ncbi:imidazolonepropionase [Ascidiimonas sp. W6]|uniref:imidazolonepropionase n=1 Tax=Ascidiimonas meishanensis TaxID=3128903 RepID=UPI0030EE97F5
MKILLYNIKQLLQVRQKSISFVKGAEMKELPLLENAFLTSSEGRITNFGKMEECPEISAFDEAYDCTGRLVLPTWCDSHTHLVFAGNRENEFRDKIQGLSYEQIAARGGGILNSVEKLRNTSERELYKQASERLKSVIAMGTGAIEIKSGYGLNTESELKMLRVIKRLQNEYPVEIKATFLGAHAIPNRFKNRKAEYLNLIITEMLPEISKLQLADFIDVFCEQNYFSVNETKRILEAANEYGLSAKIHVNQFSILGGIKVACDLNARSVDHLELLDDDDICALKNSTTIPVALPGCSFFLGIPYTPARKIMEEGIALALASDYNPGSAPSGNMNFVVSLACIKMKMTPEEAINAATINGAYAMGLENTVGTITIGKKANFMMTKKIENYNFLPYSFGNHQIENVFIKGTLIQ